jgi:acetate kinase
MILVLNAGSSSLKSAVFDPALDEVMRIEATGIGVENSTDSDSNNDSNNGGSGSLKTSGHDAVRVTLPDHAAALRAVFTALEGAGITMASLGVVGHRVVHGGARFASAALITDDVRAGIQDCVPLAPLHNPHHLAAIDAVRGLAPGLAQVACFDTAFHATNSDVARRYALPDGPQTEGLMRYGFHGTSYAALVRALPEQTGAPLPRRLLALHLGNGGSLCAILDGQSVATTMGYSPLSGITMGTRSGDIDAAAVLTLARRIGIEKADTLLNTQSGLLGLSGLSSDMRTLQAAQSPAADFAIEHFCYWIARHAGSMIAALQGLDAIAFTGGIGEHAHAIRDDIVARLSWAGTPPVWVVPAAEEQHIARQAQHLVAPHGTSKGTSHVP